MTDPLAATFLFADIAGFTALTEAHGDEQAADLVGEFTRAVARELPGVDGTHVKTIGDALMLRIPRPENAISLGLRITRRLFRIGRQSRRQDLRPRGRRRGIGQRAHRGSGPVD